MDSRDFEFLSLLAYAHLKSGGAAAAADLLAGLQAVEPEHAWVNRTLAYALLEAGRYEACLTQVERLPTVRQDKALQLIRSRALWALGRHAEARRAAAGLADGVRGLGMPQPASPQEAAG
ncbi:MAG: tetratricopeptide repeat protein [Planctomycetota bacterium]